MEYTDLGCIVPHQGIGCGIPTNRQFDVPIMPTIRYAPAKFSAFCSNLVIQITDSPTIITDLTTLLLQRSLNPIILGK